MAVANQRLRAEVEAAVLAEIDRAGPSFTRADLARRFEGRGASNRTILRWIADVMESGKAGQHLAVQVKEAAARRAERAADAAEEMAREMATRLPAVVRVEDVAGTGAISVIERIQQCIRAAQDVMAYARTEEGKVRNAKLLVSASDHLRKSLETSVRLFEAMHSVNQLEAFHAAIINQIGEESPELAERVLLRLRRLSNEWVTPA